MKVLYYEVGLPVENNDTTIYYPQIFSLLEFTTLKKSYPIMLQKGFKEVYYNIPVENVDATLYLHQLSLFQIDSQRPMNL